MKLFGKSISILVYCIFVIISNVIGQNDRRYIDSINTTLLKCKSDSKRINKLNAIYYDLVWHHSYYIKGDIIDTLENEALSMAQNIKYKRGIADAYNNLGVQEWSVDDYPTSMDDYTNAEKIEEQINYKKGLATSLDGIGEINSENQDYSDAILKFNRALSLFSEVKDTDDVEGVLEDLSECYIFKKSYDTAYIFAEKSLKSSEERHDKYIMIDALNDIGECYAIKGDYENSLKIFSKILSIINTLDDNDNQLISYYQGIANDLLKLGKYSVAIESANKSLEIANKLGSIDDIMKSENLISTIYEQMGNDNLALKYYKIYDSIHNLIFSQNNTRREQRSELNFQIEKQEVIENQQFRIVVVIFTSIISGLVIIVLSLLKIRKQNKTIEEKDIELIIANGEDGRVEFKASLKYDVGERAKELGKNKTDAQKIEIEKTILKDIEFSSIKTIAAFLNSNGGTLLIGVEDNGNILGLDNTDFSTFSKSDTKKDLNPSDEWRLYLTASIGNKIGKAIKKLIQIRLISIRSKMVAVITVKGSSEPIWMKNEKGVEELYTRPDANSQALQGQEAMKYIRLHWPKLG